jgi:hypothetical protein
VQLVEQFAEIEARLPERWRGAELRLTVPDEGDCDRAAALLGPANPGRRGKVIRFASARGGAGVGALGISSLLRRLDEEGIDGDLTLVRAEEAPEQPAAEQESLAEAWDEALAKLPEDWTDAYAEVEVFSSDHVEPAALALSPLNPGRPGSAPVFRFRVARRFGYGASPEMVRRCLERLEERNIRGRVRILWALSDTHAAYTQGPVWYVGGKVL